MRFSTPSSSEVNHVRSSHKTLDPIFTIHKDGIRLYVKTQSVLSSHGVKKIALLLGKTILTTHPSSHAFVLAFCGNLGAGKTFFIQNLARGLGILHTLPSPTFTLLRKYHIPPLKLMRTFFHIDAYRIHHARDLTTLGLRNILHDPHNIVAIEWAEKIPSSFFRHTTTLWITLNHTKNHATRTFSLTLKKPRQKKHIS